MPVYSDQVGGMIAQQNQMFAGYGSYAAGFSPGGPPGMPSWGGANSTFEEAPYTAGTKVMGAAHSMLPAAIGMGTLAGSFIPGAVGKAIGNMDPFQAALGGFGRASGITKGMAGQGFMDSIGTMGTNIGKIGSGGFGNVVRAGISGVGGAAMAAALPMAGMAAISHIGGQMVEGAQYTQQVQHSLSNNFRFLNPQAASGRGFSREQGKDIADTIREMGTKDIMSSPGEMLRLMEGGVQGGMFRAVQDAKSFKDKFKEMTKSLKEIAKTFNTTMEGAMPFLTESRRMGFWTPSDVMRLATPTQAAAINTGQSVAQVQAMQQQGAAMARQVGARGVAGAVGMTSALGTVGGAIRSGAISEQQLSDATGGLQGADAINAYAGQLQASSTRFAASRQARWLLAATANKDMTGLDQGKLGLLTSGRMGVDQIRGMAEKNIQGRGADFVMGEEDMRGDLLKMGIEGQAGFLKGIVGKQLYGDSGHDKLVTRKLIQRIIGGDSKQAEMMAQIMRNLPQIKRDNMRRSEAEADQVSRDQEQLMDHSYEGMKRKISKWWDETVNEPFKQIGSDMSKSMGDTWEKWTDKLWGRAPRGMRNRGFTSSMLKAEQASVMGDNRAHNEMFASDQEMADLDKKYGAEELGSLSNKGQLVGKNEQWVTGNGQAALVGGLDADNIPKDAMMVGNKIMRPGGVKRSDIENVQQSAMDRLAGTLGTKDVTAWAVAKTVATGGIAAAIGIYQNGGIGDKYEKSDVSDLLKGDGGEKFKQAMVKMSAAAAEKDPDKKKALRDDAKKLLGEAQVIDDSPANKELYAKLKAGGPEAEAALAEMGDAQRDLNTMDAQDVVRRRMDKVDLAKLKGLDDLTGADKKSLGLGKSLTDIVTEGRGGKMSAKKMNEKLAEVARTLAKLGDSPEARAKAAQVMATVEEAGFDVGAAALGGAADIMDVQHAFGAKGSLHEKATSLSNITGALGMNKGGSPLFSEQTIKGLMGGGKAYEKAQEDLKKKSEGMSDVEKEHLRKLATGVHEKNMEILVGEAGAGGRRAGISAFADVQKNERIDANMTGNAKTIEGLHREATEQTIQLKGIKGDTAQLVQKGGGTPTETGNSPIVDPAKANSAAHEDGKAMMSK